MSYRYGKIIILIHYYLQPRLNLLFDGTRLPINHLSPHAGLSVDVLYPVLQFIPIFCLTPERGFTLISTDDGSPKPSLPISVPLDLAFRRELEDTSGTSEHPPSRYSTEVGPSFPGHDAVSAGLLRSVTAWDSAGNDTSNQRETSSNTVYLQGDMLTAPAFTLKARRAQPVGDEVASSTANSTNVRQPVHAGNNMDFIYQSREETPLPVGQPPILLANPGGNQLFRAFLEGIGAVLPHQMRDALFDEPDERDLQEYFYPITRCPLPDDRIIPRPLSKPVLAASLEGLWVGCYSTHGFEFGIINVRNAWMPTEASSDGSSIIEQFYRDQRLQEANADLSVNREPLAPNLAGSTKVLRTIIELVKVTGDVNVPAGQVSWCAVLPRPFDQDYSTISSNASDEIMEEIEDLDISDIESIELPTVKRSDWQEWSDAPPHTAEQHYGLHNPPRWDEGSFEAAGRIAFTGFIDTRFIDAVATFIREDTGEVDEIRITWYVVRLLVSNSILTDYACNCHVIRHEMVRFGTVSVTCWCYKVLIIHPTLISVVYAGQSLMLPSLPPGLGGFTPRSLLDSAFKPIRWSWQ